MSHTTKESRVLRVGSLRSREHQKSKYLGGKWKTWSRGRMRHEEVVVYWNDIRGCGGGLY